LLLGKFFKNGYDERTHPPYGKGGKQSPEIGGDAIKVFGEGPGGRMGRASN